MIRMFNVFRTSIFVLVAATIAVHVGLYMLGTSVEKDAIGDVLNSYKPWADSLHFERKWLGVSEPWVYPFLAWAPILLAKVLVSFDYLISWQLLALSLNIVAVGQLVRWGARVEAFKAAWYYIAFIALLGPVAFTRLDGISAAMAIIGASSLVGASLGSSLIGASGGGQKARASISELARRTTPALVWFTLAAWVKVWPVALVLAVLQKGRFLIQQVKVIGVTTAIVLALGVVLGGNSNLFSFITMQTDRGLQVESPVAFVWVLMALLGQGNAIVYFDQQLITYQVAGDFVHEAAGLMSLALLVAISITALLHFNAVRAGADPSKLAAVTAFTATLDLIVFNKVGSPQYQLWLVVPVIIGLVVGVEKWRLPTYGTLVLALLTQLVYPIFYVNVIATEAAAVLLLGTRNLGLVLLLIWANVRLTKMGRRS